MTVPSVPNRSPQHLGTRSIQRSHRSHTLKGGNVGTVTQAKKKDTGR
jgi:hypothetical protein